MLQVIKKLSPTVKLRLFSLTQIPLLFIIRPKVIHLDAKSCEIKVPLNKMTKNHLNSMYFGVLAMGADAAVGTLTLLKSDDSNKKINLIFKSFKIDFVKRAEYDVVFRCSAGDQIDAMIDAAVKSGERVTEEIPGEAYTDKNNEIVAQFSLGLSIKIQQ